jgi:hypothetical protein
LHREVKISREGVCNVVGEARNVVEARDVAVVALVNAKQSEEISWRRVGSGAAFALPKSGVEVVGLLTTVRSRASKVCAMASR